VSRFESGTSLIRSRGGGLTSRPRHSIRVVTYIYIYAHHIVWHKQKSTERVSYVTFAMTDKSSDIWVSVSTVSTLWDRQTTTAETPSVLFPALSHCVYISELGAGYSFDVHLNYNPFRTAFLTIWSWVLGNKMPLHGITTQGWRLQLYQQCVLNGWLIELIILCQLQQQFSFWWGERVFNMSFTKPRESTKVTFKKTKINL
jgi:hypothetical protein